MAAGRGENLWPSEAVFFIFNGVVMFKDECKLFRMWLMRVEITFFYSVCENDKASLKNKEHSLVNLWLD